MNGQADTSGLRDRGARGGTPVGAMPSAASWRPVLPLLAVGALGVVAGGLLAAAVAHAPARTAVWLSAFLVLVVGVVQIALATGRALLARPGTGSGIAWCQFALYNLGTAGVVAGTLAGSLPLVLLGTVLFLGALASFLRAVRSAPAGPGVYAYRALIVFVAISALVGLMRSIPGPGS